MRSGSAERPAHELRPDPQLPHAADDQQAVLPAEVYHQHLFLHLRLPFYSTVTDLARFLGLSMSQPSSRAA